MFVGTLSEIVTPFASNDISISHSVNSQTASSLPSGASGGISSSVAPATVTGASAPATSSHQTNGNAAAAASSATAQAHTGSALSDMKVDIYIKTGMSRGVVSDADFADGANADDSRPLQTTGSPDPLLKKSDTGYVGLTNQG